MIRITIHSFRGVGSTKENPIPRIYEFRRGLTLLKGDSGQGKSTVIQAFRWCLYREPFSGNNSLLKNASSRPPKVQIEFVLPGDNVNFSILRTSSPQWVEVTIPPPGHQVLVNEEAERYVEKMFGKEHFWRSCCFIQQGHHNPMLEGLSATEKREVFQTMTENSLYRNSRLVMDIPLDVLRERITRMRLTLEGQVKNLEGALQVTTEFNRRSTEDMTEPIFHRPYSELEDVYREEWQIPLTRLMAEIQTLPPDEELLDKHRADLERMKKDMQVFHEFSRDFISRRSQWEGQIERNQKRLTQHEYVVQSIVDLGRLFPSLVQAKKWLQNHTTREYLERLSQSFVFIRDLYTYLRGVGRTHPSSPTEDSREFWDRLASHLRRDAEDLPAYRRYLEQATRGEKCAMELIKLEAQIATLEKDPLTGGSIMEEQRKELMQQLINIEGHPLSCPGCKRVILIRGSGGSMHGSLFEQEGDSLGLFRTSIKEEISELDRQMALHKRWKTLCGQRDVLMDEIQTNKPSASYAISRTIFEVMDRQSMELWERWQLVRKHTPSSVLDRLQENLDGSFLSEVRSILSNIHCLLTDETVGSLRVEMDQATRQISELNVAHLEQTREREKHLLGEMHGVTQRIQNGTRRVELLGRLRAQFVGLDWRRCLQDAHYLQFLMELHQHRRSLEVYQRERGRVDESLSRQARMEQELVDAGRKIKNLLELNRILDETEEDIFETTVSTITQRVNDLLENIFDQHPPRMLIRNEVRKTAKTTRDIQFQFASTLENMTSSDASRGINTYSGGEADRLSLAFTCALAAFSDCPLLFLDECISSLDTELRDRVIRTLRTVVKEKFVIVVCHDTVDGLFDHVVEI